MPTPTELMNKLNQTLPRMTATNAYGLLNDVMTAIRQEPKRLKMIRWHTCAYDLNNDIKNGQHAGRPACGTVCCVAGWIQTLTCRELFIQGAAHYSSVYETPLFNTDTEAQTVLGVTRADAPFGFREELLNLFNTFPEDPDFSDGPALVERLTSGTPEYAEVVCAQIEAFQSKYEDFLRSVPVIEYRGE